MVQLQRLEGFYWVAKAGGYARAARAFPYPITQPAVHQQVKKLEAELKVELFERVGKDRVQLTPAGERLQRFVAPFFEGLAPLARSLAAGEYGGVLSIHAAPLFLRHLLPAWIARLRRRNPAVEVRLRELPAPEFARLRSGEADLLVDYFPELPADVASMEIASLRGFLVLPAAHPLASRKRLPLAQLAGETFVGYDAGSLGHELQMKALSAHGLSPRQVITATSAEAILGFVESGLGFSLVPALAGSSPRSSGVTWIPLVSPKVELPVYAAWRKDTPENPLLDAALETAKG
jgi:DNA-binding transcriptional LysR family regulator